MEEEIRNTSEENNEGILEDILSWLKKQHWLTKFGIILLLTSLGLWFCNGYYDVLSNEFGLFIFLYLIMPLLFLSMFLMLAGLFKKKKIF